MSVCNKKVHLNQKQDKQGRIHGNPVADGWAGAVMRKPLANQKSYRRTDLPTDTASSRVACPRLKTFKEYEKPIFITFKEYDKPLFITFKEYDKPIFFTLMLNKKKNFVK